MMMTQLITDIERYIAVRESAGRRIEESTFGRFAVNDGKLMARLRAGNEIMPKTERKIRQWMADNPPEAVEQAGAA